MCRCYVIITSRTLLWTLLSVATSLSMLAAVITPTWLVGQPRNSGRSAHKPLTFEQHITNSTADAVITSANLDLVDRAPIDHGGSVYSPSLGIYNRCTKVHQFDKLYIDSCAPFATSLSVSNEILPVFWKASLVFFMVGLAVMTLTISMSLVGCCIRSICRKSIFQISGTLQAVAGLFFLLGLIAYPMAWGSRRVQVVCGKSADPFWPGDCHLGWALFLAIGSTLATFLCSLLSLQAEVSTSTDKVQDEILDGKRFICLC